MNSQADVLTPIPPWKAEFLEKKKNRAKANEQVPQWKRELLKRIQSKNERMIGEQHPPDIVEEHIPKVSNNIFLIHEKELHKFPSVVAPKPITPETSPSSQPSLRTLSVDNVIIIEKETQADTEHAGESQDFVAEVSDDREYPKAGIVHRLMGKFQEHRSVTSNTSDTDSRHHLKINTRASGKSVQRSKNDELGELGQHPIAPPPTLIEGEPPAAFSSPLSPYTMPSDMIAPLLLSSAKPFSKQSMMDAADQGYHHVSAPFRKVSAPASPKYVHTVKKNAIYEEFAQSPVKPENQLQYAALKDDRHLVSEATTAHHPKQMDSPHSASFSEDLSRLHSNRDLFVSIGQEKETVIIEKRKPDPSTGKQIDLKNGETLHSSGNAPAPEVIDTDVVSKNQHQKWSIKSTLSDGEAELAKNEIIMEKMEKLSLGAKVASIPTNTSKPSNTPTDKTKTMALTKGKGGQENQGISYSQYREIVNESFDESILKTQAAKAANRIMQTSKTFKITPSKVKAGASQTVKHTLEQRNLSKSAKDREENFANGNSDSQQSLPLLSREQYSPAVTENRKSEEKVSATVQTTEWQPTISRNNLPSTSIDDIIAGPGQAETFAISSPSQSMTTKHETEQKVESSVKVQQAIPKGITQPHKNASATTQISFITRTSPNSISVAPKSGPGQTAFAFGAKRSGMQGRGKSFIIDPSKFRKSCAQPPPAGNTSHPVKESGSTRMVVPGARPINASDTDFVGEQQKTGKRKLTVDQITVVGGYVSLEKSCLVKDTKRKKSVSLKFSEKALETTHTYVSERSLLQEDIATDFQRTAMPPGFGKEDSTIGKYTPKYLLSLKTADVIDEDENDIGPRSTSGTVENTPNGSRNDLTPSTDDNAAAWSDTTSTSTDILF